MEHRLVSLINPPMNQAKLALELLFKRALRFITLGVTDCNDELATIGHIEIMGAYPDCEAVDRLLTLRPNLIWLASTCPETYNYMPSTAAKTCVRCVAFDIEVIARRISEMKCGSIKPLRPDRSARCYRKQPDGELRRRLSCFQSEPGLRHFRLLSEGQPSGLSAAPPQHIIMTIR